MKADTTIPIREGELIKAGPSRRPVDAIENSLNLYEMEIIGEFVDGSGQYVMLPKGTRVLTGIRALLDRYVKAALNFEEVVLPKMAPVDSFEKAGIIGKWNDYLISAKPFSGTNGVREEYIMDPLQCTVFYQFHENKMVDVSEGARKWYDCSGPSYRNEDSDKIVPGVKQREFHRAEFMYIGTKRQVINAREECLAQLETMCDDLGLEYRIVVGSGCYQLKDGEIRLPESAEEIPIKDLEIFCPGYKNNSGEPYLEVAGSSVLADAMISRFNIHGQNGEALWSGCTGIGLNRLVYAVVSNHGLENMPIILQGAMR